MFMRLDNVNNCWIQCKIRLFCIKYYKAEVGKIIAIIISKMCGELYVRSYETRGKDSDRNTTGIDPYLQAKQKCSTLQLLNNANIDD